ncbi:MAG: adenosylcobalamin-dependent ribonucleoside-diphosphate reductase [Candidatus Melainabacteria bacterium]|jgi:ribonucleoside-diphosphate reductase alpha chain|nr:adenosylcobalamin-dependent ribonucleoside-diphosphate reductase [Candidatus Melainabacteria bacterium]
MQQAHTVDPRNGDFTANALKVLERRYFLRDGDGHICENPEQLFLRVARAIASIESRFGLSESEIDDLTEIFKDLMLDRKFLPNSPTLMNAGKPKGQLSACFVLPVPDDLAGIFETCKHAALIHKTGGGTGFSFSRLRPQNDPVASSIGVASGPVSFMTVFDAATEAIRQGGTRRGANMGMLRVDHPDIQQFIQCKRDTSKLNNFNISVAVTDAFMQAVIDRSDYDLINPRTKEPTGQRLSAPAVFEMMVANAHATGEPGMVFIDRINAADPVRQTLGDDGKTPIPGTEDIEATNPCGEQPLGPGDACNLGSINVARFVKADGSGFDLESLGQAVDLAVRFLDDVIEANHYPFDFVHEATHNNRRIGLGIMGFADALIMQGIAYDSERGTKCGAELMAFIQERAHQQSRLLAKQRGVFPNWRYSTWYQQGIEMRNATVTTIAPTGTISIIAGTSSGIEPLFAVSYVRRVMGGTELIEVNPLFERAANAGGFYSTALMARIAHQGTVAHDDEVPGNIREIFRCAHDIDYISHVEMQAAFQRYTDNAVSKTINFPSSATVLQIEQAYLSAWHLGLKGITVYRDASRQSQVLNIGKTDPTKKPFNAGPEESATDSPAPALLLDQIASIAMLYDSRDIRLDERCPGCDTPSDLHVKYESCYLCPSCGYTKC